MLLTENQLLQLLIEKIKNVGSQGAFAHKYNIDRSSLNNILRRKRSISPKLAAKLGYKPVVMYERVSSDDKT